MCRLLSIGILILVCDAAADGKSLVVYPYNFRKSWNNCTSLDQHALWLISYVVQLSLVTLCLHLDSRQADTRQNQSSKLIFGSHTHPNTAFFNVSRTRPRWFNNVAGVGSDTSSQQLSALAEEFFTWRIETWPNYGTRFGINDYNNLTVEYTEGEFIRQRVSKAHRGRVRFSRG